MPLRFWPVQFYIFRFKSSYTNYCVIFRRHSTSMEWTKISSVWYFSGIVGPPLTYRNLYEHCYGNSLVNGLYGTYAFNISKSQVLIYCTRANEHRHHLFRPFEVAIFGVCSSLDPLLAEVWRGPYGLDGLTAGLTWVLENTDIKHGYLPWPELFVSYRAIHALYHVVPLASHPNGEIINERLLSCFLRFFRYFHWVYDQFSSSWLGRSLKMPLPVRGFLQDILLDSLSILISTSPQAFERILSHNRYIIIHFVFSLRALLRQKSNNDLKIKLQSVWTQVMGLCTSNGIDNRPEVLSATTSSSSSTVTSDLNLDLIEMSSSGGSSSIRRFRSSLRGVISKPLYWRKIKDKISEFETT